MLHHHCLLLPSVVIVPIKVKIIVRRREEQGQFFGAGPSPSL